MKKKLVIINGVMGVGKSTVCELLYKKINHSVWLDGDWCWMMNPWNFSEENKAMVMDNISYLLSNYLKNTSFEFVIFSWVLHLEEILEDILSRLANDDFELIKITLTATAEAIRERRHKDHCNEQSIQESIDRLKNYETMDTFKLDTTALTPKIVVDEVLNIIY